MGHQPPIGWASSHAIAFPRVIKEAWDRKSEDSSSGLVNVAVEGLRPRSASNPEALIERKWYTELEDVNRLKRNMDSSVREDVLELLGNINCTVLRVERDCARKSNFIAGHDLHFFTNHRVLQVYCAHSYYEHLEIQHLHKLHHSFTSDKNINRVWDPEPYEEYMKAAFITTGRLLIWETVFPSHELDMEALSPRDVNARSKPKQVDRKGKAVEKAPPPRSLQREKDHPPPPPPQVIEPPSSDRQHGAVYNTGRLLGRGGFAICYEAKLGGTKQIVALKIVKSLMPQKKMEQKFQTELQIHSKMKHPNIVKFYRAFAFEESTYIVLELCSNGSLMDMIKKRRYVTEPEVRFYAVQMAGAIKYMHAKGIIHRDLKMGNVFLDKDMNIKIGDFGLAALLMSGKDMNACRRTTLCGTPNYIAPEILEKGKKGHDQAVDIWALGIIIFALLTGKPPFQSTTQDEIYRKARELEYDWPKLSTSDNYIGQEAKDLVTVLLQKPEDRPDPDTIVQHAFFSSGWVPQQTEMSLRFLNEAPSPDDFLSVGLRGGRANVYTKNLKKLCIKSEVGPFGPATKIAHSTYKEVAAEEQAGLTPVVPLAAGIVYRPFDEILREYEELVARESAENLVAGDQAHQERGDSSKVDNAPPSTASTWTAPQSFAAQQRAQHQPASGITPSLTQKTHTVVDRTSSQKAPTTIDGRIKSMPIRRKVKAGPLAPLRQEHEREPLKPSETAEARIGADLVQQLGNAQAVQKSQSDGTSPSRIDNRIPLENRVSIFSPRERPQLMLQTRPFAVHRTLEKLNAELDRALKARSIGPVPRGGKPKPPPNIVVKWVDYTNKFGLGYILSNGSVGCVFRSSAATSSGVNVGQIPPTCIVVRDAEQHLQNRTRKGYLDGVQIIPIGTSESPSAPVEFYESGELGIFKVKVAATNFKITTGDNGEGGKLARGKDAFDDRKREKLVIWNKFANYMTAFGRDQDYPYDDALQRVTAESQEGANDSGNVIIFYQRFGDVGCWIFGDGHLQFNFPDHTKVVLSADGVWCDFYHLPFDAARDLALTGTLAPAALDDRQHLSYPLQTLLNFMEKTPKSGKISSKSKEHDIDPMKQGIPNANDFRRKIQFIKSAVDEWVKNNGLGNSDMSPEGRLRWMGHRERVSVKIPYKHVWVTVGARNSDDRRVAWFDPNKPNEIKQDIET